jgi:hypothetical protein
VPAEFDVTTYGATGNGTTDDTVAIQNAVAALPVFGGTLYFPTGTYKTTSPINLSAKQNVQVRGSGPSTVIIAGALVGFPLFVVTTPGGNIVGYEFRNLRLNGNGLTGTSGIVISGISEASRVSEVRIENVSAALLTQGLTLTHTANLYITDVFISACTTGVTLDNCADANLSQVMVQNGAGVGFRVIGSIGGAADEGLRMNACSTNGQAQGLTVNNHDWANITGCSFTTTTGDAVVLASVTDWKFSGCEFSPAGESACLNMDTSCGNIGFSNNFFALGTFGLVLKGTRHTAFGNQFVGNSNVDIQIDTATLCAVTGNQCNSTGVDISINETGASNNNNISANIVNGSIIVIGGGSREGETVFY